MNRQSPAKLGVMLAFVFSGCKEPTGDKTPTDLGTHAESPCGTDSGTGCAPDSARVDMYEPVFSDPTNVTNPLFPIGLLQSVVFAGVVDGEPFRTETTLLPETRMIEWNGQQIEVLTSQYMAFSGGRIEEIATDWYAQDDNGGVWYFGEDVADYNEDGVVFTNEGTWLVGRDDAPLTMIMPANPQVGDVYRAENVAPIAWEEVTVVETSVALDGPSGPIGGAMIGSELHMEGTRQEKIFAPGYGEFSTGSLETDDLEALALAIPTDALAIALPLELDSLAAGTADIFEAAAASDWATVDAALASVSSAWSTYTAGQVPPLLASEMDRLMSLLVDAAAAHNAHDTRHEVIAMARIVFDLRLRHLSPTEIDPVRFDLWLAQVLVDAAAGDAGSVRGDGATLGLVWHRFAHTLDSTTAGVIEARLAGLEEAAAADDLVAAASIASDLRVTMAGLGWK